MKSLQTDRHYGNLTIVGTGREENQTQFLIIGDSFDKNRHSALILNQRDDQGNITSSSLVNDQNGTLVLNQNNKFIIKDATLVENELHQKDTIFFGSAVSGSNITAGDVKLYRSMQDTLRTDDNFTVQLNSRFDGKVFVNQDTFIKTGSSIIFGSSQTDNTFTAGDQKIYRSVQNTIRTDSHIVIDKTLTTTGNTSLQGNLQVLGQTVFENDIQINADQIFGQDQTSINTIRGTVNISDPSYLTTIKGELDVNQHADFLSTVSIIGNTDVSGNFVVRGNTTLGDSADDTQTILGTVNLSSTGKPTSVKGSLQVSQTSTFSGAVSINNSATISNNLTVKGNTTLGDQDTDVLTVNGTVNLSSIGKMTTIRGLLTANEQVDFDSTLNVDGQTTLNSILDVDGQTQIHNNLTVDGNTVLGNQATDTQDINGIVNISNTGVKTTIEGNLQVNEQQVLKSTVDIDGQVNINNALIVDGITVLGDAATDSSTIRGTVNISDPGYSTTIKGTLNTKQQVDFDGTLNVDGQTTLGSTLGVVDEATFNDNVSIGGNLNVAGNITGTIAWQNLINVPDPTITLSGDLSGSQTMTDLGSITIIAEVLNDSHTHDTRYYTETEADNRFVNVSGDTMTGALTINGNTQLRQKLDVDGATTLKNTLNVYGNTVLGDAQTDTTTIRGAVNVSDPGYLTTIKGTLNVQQQADFDGGVNIDGQATLNNILDVDGQTQIHNNLTVDGNTILGNQATDTTTIRGAITASDPGYKTNILGSLDVQQQTLLKSTLNVNGNTTLGGLLNVSGIISALSDLEVQGNTFLDSSLDVYGTTLLRGTLDVHGDTVLGNSVDDTTIIRGTVNLSDSGEQTTIEGMLFVDEQQDFSDTLTVDGISTFNNDVNIVGPDTVNRVLSVMGTNQGTGVVYVGESLTYGGGMFYNGDLNPQYATGEQADRVSFFRRNNGTNTVVFDYGNSSNDVSFKGQISVQSQITLGSQATATNHQVRQDRTITINGTANQINVSGGTQNLTQNRTWTLSLPQNIHQQQTPIFSGMTLNGQLQVPVSGQKINLKSSTNNTDDYIEMGDSTYNWLIKYNGTQGNQLTIESGYTGSTQKLSIVHSGLVSITGDLNVSGNITGTLNWANLINVPDPVITLSGDVSGSGTLTDLSSVNIQVVVQNDSHSHSNSTITSVDWSKLLNVPDPIITLTGDVSGSQTMTNLGNATITQVVQDDSHNHSNDTITSVAWGKLTGVPSPVITLGGDLTGSQTLTSLGNTTLTQTVVDDSHEHSNDTITSVDWSKLLNVPDPVITLTGDVTGSQTMTNLGSITITQTVQDDSHTHDGRYYTESEADSRFFNVAGDTITGTLAVNGISTFNNDVNIVGADTVSRVLSVHGTTEGTGVIYVGQSATYGGGMFYNGDLNPQYATGEQADRVSFFRRNNGTNVVVFDYGYGSNDVSFKGQVSVAGNLSVSGSITGTIGWSNLTGVPSPVITLGGDLTGSQTLTNLGNATLTQQVVDDSHNHSNTTITSVDWSKLLNVPDPVITLTGDVTGSQTMTNLGSATLTQAVVDDSHNHSNATITSLAWSKLTGVPSPVITLGGDLTGSQTLTSLGNATLTQAVVDDSHNHSNATITSLAWSKLTGVPSPVITLTGGVTGSQTMTSLGNATITQTVQNDSHTHDTRYYTEAEADSRFFNVAGDTITGTLTVNGASTFNNPVQVNSTLTIQNFQLQYNASDESFDFIYVS